MAALQKISPKRLNPGKKTEQEQNSPPKTSSKENGRRKPTPNKKLQIAIEALKKDEFGQANQVQKESSYWVIGNSCHLAPVKGNSSFPLGSGKSVTKLTPAKNQF